MGGHEKVALTVAEMPKHTHRLSTGYGMNWHDGLAGGTGEVGVDPVFNDPNPAINRESGRGIVENVLERVGGSQPHNNMPPYIALYYCKKG